MAEEVWHVGIQGERKGPFAEEQVREMIERGELTARDVVWREGMEDWQPAEEVETFAEAVKTAPPAPPAPRAAGPNPFAQFFNTFWKQLRAILVDPDGGLATAADNKDICFSVTWLVLGVLVFALLVLQAYSQVFTLTAVTFGIGGKSGAVVFLKGLLHAVILYVIWFGVLLVTLVPILRSQATWEDVVSILALSSIPTASIGLATFALAWIHPFFLVFLYLGAVANIVFYFRLFCHVGRTTTRAAIYAVPATYFVPLLLYNLLRLGMT